MNASFTPKYSTMGRSGFLQKRCLPATMLILMLSVALQAQFKPIDVTLKDNQNFTVLITGISQTGCGSSKAGFCQVSDDNCFTEQGQVDKITLDGYQGVHLMDRFNPDTFDIRIVDENSRVLSWTDVKVDLLGGDDDIIFYQPLQGGPGSVGAQDFIGQIIITPTDLVRENEDEAKILTFLYQINYEVFEFPNVVQKFMEISIPFVILGPEEENIQAQGTTLAPQIPYMILHDPPGDGSSSEFLASRQTCRSFSTSYLIGGAARVWGRAKAGFETKGAVPAEAYVELEAGLSVGVEHASQTETELCITTTNTFGTSDGDENTGNAGDLFIGSGNILEYGVARTLIFDANSCTTKLEKTLAFRTVGQYVQFSMTESQIRADIIEQQKIVDNPAFTQDVRARAASQIDAWNRVLELNEANKANAFGNPQTKVFGGQVTVAEETEVSTTSVQTIETTVSIGLDVAVEVGAEIQGSGGAAGVQVEIRSEFGESTTTSGSTTQVIGYTLTDDDATDRFNITVGKDPMYGTPVFALNAGSQTSCPYEGGVKIDQPRLSATVQCATGKEVIISNVLTGTPVTLDLNVCNDSQYERTYYLALENSSNVNGARFNFSGTVLNTTSIGAAYTLPPGTCFNNNGVTPKLIITQNPANANLLNYENMKVYLYPICEGQTLGELAIVDQIDISVKFVQDTIAVTQVTVDGVAGDRTPPTITSCPQSRTVNNNPGFCGEAVAYNLPTAVDNCSAVTITRTEGPASNGTFFIGTTPVVFAVRDENGNTATCRFEVTVIDNEPPRFTSCPSNYNVNVAPGACGEIINYPLPTFLDNCDARMERTAGPAGGENFFPGTTAVTHWLLDNSGNTAECTFTVTVTDNEAPAITFCPENRTVDAVLGGCGTYVGYNTPTAFDNCVVASTTRVEGPASGELFPIGITTVKYAFSDNYSNTSNCTFQVTVVDNQYPSITSCPDSVVVTTAPDQCSSPVSWEVPTAVDNCGITSVTSTANPGDVFEVGVDTVTYSFTDAVGYVNTCSFRVVVKPGDAVFCQGSNDCGETDLVVSESPVSSGTYHGVNTLRSNTIVDGNETVVVFKAGSSITLEPGFQVTAGAQFRAFIESCPGGGNFAAAAPAAPGPPRFQTEANPLPSVSALSVRPNPSRHQATIHYELSEPGRIDMVVFDLQGRQVLAPLSNQYQNAGRHQLMLKAQDLKPGFYSILMRTPTGNRAVKMMVLH